MVIVSSDEKVDRGLGKKKNTTVSMIIQILLNII